MLTPPDATRPPSPIPKTSDTNASDQNLQQPPTSDNMVQGLKTIHYISAMGMEPAPKAGPRKNVTNNRKEKEDHNSN